MNIDEFIDNFAGQFDETDASVFKADVKFKELDEWSSLTAISVIMMIQSCFGIKISGEDLKRVNTIRDLYNLATGTKNNQNLNGYVVKPVDEDHITDLQKCAAKFGMPRSEEWLRRCMFDPTAAGKVIDKIRGHVAFDADDAPVASQGYYYIPCYYKQKQILGHTVCFKSALSKCGESLLSVLDRNSKTREKTELGFGNCIANMPSAEINMKMYGWEEPPERSRTYRVGVAAIAAYPIAILRRIWRVPPKIFEVVCWSILLPAQWILNVLRTNANRRFCFTRYNAIDEAKFGDFWMRFLLGNNGVVTSREPARLKWFFDDSIKTGNVVLVAAEQDGRIQGYFMMRALVDSRWAKTYEIIDICAVGNDPVCLRALAKKALTTAFSLKGTLVHFYGYMSGQESWLDCVFKTSKKIDHPTFLYRAENPEIRESLERNEGWFFGPFDGERCLGHGGYIDL